MGHLTLTFFSQALRKQSHMVVVFPDRIAHSGPYPVLYLLHGLGDDHTTWTRMTSLERHVGRLPLIVAMPDAHRSFYCDAAYGLAYDQYIVEDVIGTVDRLFHTRNQRVGRCIGGLSMGGYGAVKLALKYPALFISATGHSGAYFRDFGQIPDELHDELSAVFGGSSIPDEDNCYRLAQEADPERLPALRLDCGLDDFLIEINRGFHAHLDSSGIAHEYAECPGAHNWAYWDEQVQQALAFHARHLKIEPQELVAHSFTRPEEPI